ncbi:4Fe-4S cluster-binding domain-containing protein [Mycoplasmatota bacterium WC30]
MRNYITYESTGHTIFVSLFNGNQIILPNNTNYTNKNLKRIFQKNNMDIKITTQEIYKKEIFKTIYISLHASSKCNMKCKYCFMQSRPDVNITIDEAKDFIDFIISEFPNAEKFIVDPTGSGEPLLRMDFILKLSKYCHSKSNEVCKEVLPMLVTNGTLLSNDNIHKLQSAVYMFSVSIGGYQ